MSLRQDVIDGDLPRRKRKLRQQARARRAALTADERRGRSLDAVQILMSSPAWRKAERVALFHSMGDEIETRLLIKALWEERRPVALPVAPPIGNPLVFRWVTERTPLSRSRYGALEPDDSAERAELSAFDLLVVPGLAFDSRGARLGYGGGYYDRTLVATSSSATVVMLCFGCQQADEVPEEPHDQRIDGVITQHGWAVPPG